MNIVKIQELIDQIETFDNKTFEQLIDSGKLQDVLSRTQSLIDLDANFKKYFEEKSEYFSNNINFEKITELEQLLTKLFGFINLDVVKNYCINNLSSDIPCDLMEIRQVLQETGLTLDDIKNFQRKINITRKLKRAQNFSFITITGELSPFFPQPHFGTQKNVDFQDFIDYLNNLFKFFLVYSNTSFIQGQKIEDEYEKLINNLKIFIKGAEHALVKKPNELNIYKYYVLRYFFKAKTEITHENYRILIHSVEIVLREFLRLTIEKIEKKPKNNFNLSPNQIKVLKYISLGTEYKEIAKELNLSESRIKGIAREIREKLNVRTNAEAINIYNNQ